MTTSNSAYTTSTPLGDNEWGIDSCRSTHISKRKDLLDLLDLPNCSANLLSVSKIAERNKVIVFDNKKCYIYDKADCKISGKHLATGSNTNGVC